ncbi:hypothetical protein OW158_03355 [Xanthomonas fragariae]|nr:hypothetical protein [Xanthomonas fragariae]WIY74159.1 hypothetical protein OW158_03355 [Xanthomonas fragariae]
MRSLQVGSRHITRSFSHAASDVAVVIGSRPLKYLVVPEKLLSSTNRQRCTAPKDVHPVARIQARKNAIQRIGQRRL